LFGRSCYQVAIGQTSRRSNRRRICDNARWVAEHARWNTSKRPIREVSAQKPLTGSDDLVKDALCRSGLDRGFIPMMRIALPRFAVTQVSK